MGYPDWQTYQSLATLIGEALQSAGIPILSNPIQLYNTQPIGTPTGTPGQFGVTIAPGGPAVYGTGTTQSQAVADWGALIGRTPTCRKIYMGAGAFPTQLDSTMQSCLDDNLVAVMCYKPSVSGSASDKAAMLNSLSTLHGLGLNIHSVVLWQECNGHKDNLTSAQVESLYQYYGPSLRTAGYKLYISYLAWQEGLVSSTTYWPPAVGQTIDGVSVDFYADDWNNGRNLDIFQTLADGAGIPLSLGEMGNQASGTNPTQQTVTAYLQYITAFMQARSNAGKPNGPCMWYQGTGVGAIVDPGDYRIALLAALCDVLTITSNPGLGAGSQLVLTPNQPSPVAGYAIANGMSYDIVVQAIAGPASTNPFVNVKLSWLNDDSLSAARVFQQIWSCPMSGSTHGGCITTGAGPQRARYLQVQLNNLDTDTAKVAIVLNSTGRQASRDDWRWDVSSAPAMPVYTGAAGAQYGLSLGEFNGLNVNPGATVKRLMSLYSGAAQLRLFVNGAAGVRTVHATATLEPQSRFGSFNWLSQYLPQSANLGDNDVYFNLYLPRAPLLIAVLNNDANAITVSAEMVALET
jgi:hypothetical protein